MAILSPENKEKLIKRFKSLLWRGAMVGLAALVNFAAESLELFSLPPAVIGLIGLVLGEVSKWIANSRAGK